MLIEIDGIRSNDLEFQKEVDRRYKECLEEFRVKYIALSGSNEQRVEQAIEHLK